MCFILHYRNACNFECDEEVVSISLILFFFYFLKPVILNVLMRCLN